MAHIYEAGTRAWQPDPTEGWVASEVKEKLVDGDKVQLIFELENGEVGVEIAGTIFPDIGDGDKLTGICYGIDKNSGHNGGRTAGR